jgi:hypothetical protein
VRATIAGARSRRCPPRCGSVACVALDGVLHGIGGAVGDTFADKRSVDCTSCTTEGRTAGRDARPLPTGATTSARSSSTAAST